MQHGELATARLPAEGIHLILDFVHIAGDHLLAEVENLEVGARINLFLRGLASYGRNIIGHAHICSSEFTLFARSTLTQR